MNTNSLNQSDPFISRVESTYSVRWAAENGDLFVGSWDKFYRDYPHPEWTITSKTTRGTITLIATNSKHVGE